MEDRGALCLTNTYRKYAYTPLRIYANHYFIPEHHSGVTYNGKDKVYAHQLWGSTRRTYDVIHTQNSLKRRPGESPLMRRPSMRRAVVRN